MPTIRLSLDRPTGNFWIDTGIVVLVDQLGEGEHDAEQILQELLSKLVQPTGKKGQYYDEASRQFREYDKVNWIYPTNIFIKVSGSAPKKKIKGQTFFTAPPEFTLNLKLSKKPDICDICGDRSLYTDAKMWMYPFVVTPDKFGTFYPSGGKRGLKLCARCALAGLAAYLGWLWRAQGRDALHFFIFDSELPELQRLQKEVLQPLQVEGITGGNAPTSFWGPYIHETTLGLLLALFSHVRQSDRLSEDAQELLATFLGATATPPPPITLYAITGTPGQAFNMKALYEFSKLQSLYRLYEQWINTLRGIDDNPHQRLVSIFRQFETQQGDKRESIRRDKIAWAVLEFGDPLPFVEQFLFEDRARENNPRPLQRGTIKVFDHYVREVLKMDEQFQQTLAGFGHSLGAVAHEHNELGLLYALRNAKNPDEFYRVLNDIQFRLKLTIPKLLLRIEKGERIAGMPWKRVKTLLSIYAMNAYLMRKTSEQEEEATSNSKEEG